MSFYGENIADMCITPPDSAIDAIKEHRRFYANRETEWQKTFKEFCANQENRKDREAIAFFKDEIKDCQRYVKTASIIIGYFEGTNNSLEVSPELNSYAVWALCVMRLHLWKLHDEKK